MGEYEELLNLIAERMDAKIVEFKTVDEVTEIENFEKNVII